MSMQGDEVYMHLPLRQFSQELHTISPESPRVGSSGEMNVQYAQYMYTHILCLAAADFHSSSF